MGLEIESDYEKSSTVGLSPNTVLPSKQNCPVPKTRTMKSRSSRRDKLLVLKGEFREISFSRYRSVSCKNAPSSRRVSQECGAEFRRGSIYQTSGEVRRMREMGASEERRKIEISRGSDNRFSIFDSLCSSGEENLKRRSTEPSSVARPRAGPDSSDRFFEICLDPGSRGNNAAETMGRETLDSSLRSDPVVGPLNNGNELLERDAAKELLNKSVSAKVEMPSSPSVYESDCSSKASLKTRFGPIRKMFDPFTKSKSSRNPLSSAAEPGERQSKTCSKLSLHEISERELLCETQFLKSKNQLVLSASPVHLHGYLKVENKLGLPFFKFSLQCRKDVFVAKTWKAKDAFNWVYTFHSVNGGKKSNASRSGLLDSDKECSMVGQMQVSCYLCSELKDGTFDNSMVTEFVLYDIAHARLSVLSQENSTTTCNASDNTKSSGEALGSSDERTQTRDYDSSDSYPWAAENLRPSLEIAAVVMQAPFEKRESLKHKRGDDKRHDKTHQNLLNLSMVEPVKQNPGGTRTAPDKVRVVIPAGNHGLPSPESGPGRPSSLLDRWRLGGGCDCGGWDMACPLTVLGNPNFRCANNSLSLVENQMPMELFVQGNNKDSTPALTMTVIEEGLYAVDFHAQLSTLQAFSVCVAILHGTETSSDERDQKLPQGNSLKVLIEEEVKFLIEAVAAEKKNVTKRVKEIPPSYMLNPPFSPIARV